MSSNPLAGQGLAPSFFGTRLERREQAAYATSSLALWRPAEGASKGIELFLGVEDTGALTVFGGRRLQTDTDAAATAVRHFYDESGRLLDGGVGEQMEIALRRSTEKCVYWRRDWEAATFFSRFDWDYQLPERFVKGDEVFKKGDIPMVRLVWVPFECIYTSLIMGGDVRVPQLEQRAPLSQYTQEILKEEEVFSWATELHTSHGGALSLDEPAPAKPQPQPQPQPVHQLQPRADAPPPFNPAVISAPPRQQPAAAMAEGEHKEVDQLVRVLYRLPGCSEPQMTKRLDSALEKLDCLDIFLAAVYSLYPELADGNFLLSYDVGDGLVMTISTEQEFQAMQRMAKESFDVRVTFFVEPTVLFGEAAELALVARKIDEQQPKKAPPAANGPVRELPREGGAAPAVDPSTAKWQFDDNDNGRWVDFEPYVMKQLRGAYRSGIKTTYVSRNMTTYQVDFNFCTMRCLNSSKTTMIRMAPAGAPSARRAPRRWSAPPRRVQHAAYMKWQFLDVNHTWQDMESHVSRQLSQLASAASWTHQKRLRVKSTSYDFDVSLMRQTNVSSGTRRPIRRVPSDWAGKRKMKVQWQDDDGSWREYPKTTSGQLVGLLYNHGQRHRVHGKHKGFQLNGSSYKIDMDRLTQTNTSSQKERAVRVVPRDAFPGPYVGYVADEEEEEGWEHVAWEDLDELPDAFVWQFKGDGVGVWKTFEKQHSRLLERRNLTGTRLVQLTAANGSRYEVDLRMKQQRNLATHKRRAIRRVASSVPFPARRRAQPKPAKAAVPDSPFKWQWRDDKAWKDLSKANSAAVEQAHAAGRGKCRYVHKGTAFEVNFGIMRQTNQTTRRLRDVRRVPRTVKTNSGAVHRREELPVQAPLSWKGPRRPTHGERVMTLYFACGAARAQEIEQAGMLVRGAQGAFAGGFYFSETDVEAKYRAPEDDKGFLVACKVFVGKALDVENGHGAAPHKFAFRSLFEGGHDSVWAKNGAGCGQPERVVFATDQVVVQRVTKYL